MNEQMIAALAAALNNQQLATAPTAPTAPAVTIRAPICEVTRADGSKVFRMGDAEVTRVVGGPVRMFAHKKVRYSAVYYTAQAVLTASGHARVVGAASPTADPYVVGAHGSSIDTVDADGDTAVEAAPEPLM